MKIGIDIHGVLDKNPFFKQMALMMLHAGHEVHIITGTSTELALKDLASLDVHKGIHYTHIYSITDDLINNNIPVEWKDGNNPLFPQEEWNISKSRYCTQHNITIHFDDSSIYGAYFSTPYAYIKQ